MFCCLASHGLSFLREKCSKQRASPRLQPGHRQRQNCEASVSSRPCTMFRLIPRPKFSAVRFCGSMIAADFFASFKRRAMFYLRTGFSGAQPCFFECHQQLEFAGYLRGLRLAYYINGKRSAEFVSISLKKKHILPLAHKETNLAPKERRGSNVGCSV